MAPGDHYTGKSVEVRCACGWRQSAPAGSGGLGVQCPRCSAALTVPMFDASLSGGDQRLMESLTGRRLARRPPTLRLFMAGLFLGAALACAILLTRQDLKLVGAMAFGAPALALFALALHRR